MSLLEAEQDKVPSLRSNPNPNPNSIPNPNPNPNPNLRKGRIVEQRRGHELFEDPKERHTRSYLSLRLGLRLGLGLGLG